MDLEWGMVMEHQGSEPQEEPIKTVGGGEYVPASKWPYGTAKSTVFYAKQDCSQLPVTTVVNRATTLPTDAKERKTFPVATGVLDYFPDALVAISRLSYEGNNQHNPGQPLHWAREKSTDQADTLIRHFLERGTLDQDGQRHSAKLAWRALALLQLEIEAKRKP